MTMQNAAPEKSSGPSIQAIWGILGALAGIVTTIFAAGIYYQSMTARLNDYIKKIDANEAAILSLKNELAAIVTFKADLIRGHVDPASPDSSNMLCPQGSYVQGIGAASQSGGEHGQIYAVNVVCRRFGTP
ncbi:hypothetical protein [Bradyrhizobium sp. LTSP857]|jgi:hypothetical protein|uniref:hypothetical protein n=1 Tax=Bradyrhizobium sp. LTSP857 TaxID=1619231 RepID=UPI0005D1E2E5|nr:hypothetical protein [Bradyrhizobium sp. LTSP857]KJC53549.1 hypothetical protein UP06_00340 [Bradyrhizobium sp. LTSP857]